MRSVRRTAGRPSFSLSALLVNQESKSKRLLKPFNIAIIIRATYFVAIKYSAVGARG
jgi:hypothetical protein